MTLSNRIEQAALLDKIDKLKGQKTALEGALDNAGAAIARQNEAITNLQKLLEDQINRRHAIRVAHGDLAPNLYERTCLAETQQAREMVERILKPAT